jgi:hypothetical protein
MNDEDRQRQMDFRLEQQARHDHEIAQIRRILLSGIRIARRDRAEFREKLNILVDAQIRNEEGLVAFRNESQQIIAAMQAETREFKSETRQAFSKLTKSVVETIDRVDASKSHAETATIRSSNQIPADAIASRIARTDFSNPIKTACATMLWPMFNSSTSEMRATAPTFRTVSP